MDISTTHQNAVTEACRLPALNARLALIAQPDAQAAERTQIAFYATAYPSPPGSAPGAAPIVTIPMTDTAGVVDDTNKQIVIDTPIEAQVDGADPTNGSVPVWARITTFDGNWWADVTVTAEGGGG